jgi:hypothetical protein
LRLKLIKLKLDMEGMNMAMAHDEAMAMHHDVEG